MTTAARPARHIPAIVALLLTALLTLTSCTPPPPLTTPVGVWEATEDDNGTLTIDTDGTFTITNASFDPIMYTDTDNNFNGKGTWHTFPNDPELILRFSEAANGDFAVAPTGRSADFTSGTMLFTDPDELQSIEFRLTTPTPTPPPTP
ncbi:hypothetical protein AB0O87_01295 [Microbacterium sp. NPDC076768]|uniref:hypothetical protein n=1 Tax=Microbacterium sp. NPDC076768 TaxID=3154858 RepID=UPI00341EA81A